MRWKYAKLLMNLGNAVQALCAPGGTKALLDIVRAEGVAALRGAGIDFASDAEDEERRRDKLDMRPIGGSMRGGGSTWQSFARGTGSIETDFLNGEIVLLGRLHGVPTPANALVQRLANAAAAERRPPGSMTAADVLAQL
jgi:2-dehydropantoate 2-reductase